MEVSSRSYDKLKVALLELHETTCSKMHMGKKVCRQLTETAAYMCMSKVKLSELKVHLFM